MLKCVKLYTGILKEEKNMRLSHKTICKVDERYSNIIGHMCYAAYKLWNVCNYERMHYQKLDLPVPYPNWYYQKSAHKNDLWFTFHIVKH